MSESVTTLSAFPEVIGRLFQTDDFTEEFKIRYINGVALVIPVRQPKSPMLGFLSDGSNGTQATDDFMRRKQEEKELEL